MTELITPHLKLKREDIEFLQTVKKHAIHLLYDYKDEIPDELVSWSDLDEKDRSKCHSTWFHILSGRLALAERFISNYLKETGLFNAIEEGRKFMTVFITKNRTTRTNETYLATSKDIKEANQIILNVIKEVNKILGIKEDCEDTY